MGQPQIVVSLVIVCPFYGRDHDGRHPHQAQINRLEPIAGNRPQQPPQVESRWTQDRVHGITVFALEPTLAHPVIGLEIPNHRLDGLSALEPFALLGAQAFRHQVWQARNGQAQSRQHCPLQAGAQLHHQLANDHTGVI